MKVDPRIREVGRASTKLRLFLHEISDQHDLSTNELMLILTDTTHNLYAVLVREERSASEE